MLVLELILRGAHNAVERLYLGGVAAYYMTGITAGPCLTISAGILRYDICG